VHDAAGANVDSYTSNNTAGYQPAGSEWSRAFERPRPGAWEVIVENSQDTDRVDRSFPNPLPPSAYAVRAELLGADVALVSQPFALNGGELHVPIEVTNRFGSFNGALKGSVLGTARSERTTLTREVPQRIFRIDVPPGADRLVAEVDNASDPGADIDLYLFDCTGKRCALRAHSTADGSREQVKAYTPAAGVWNVVVDAFRLSADSTRVEYRDLLLHPLYGQLEVTDPPSTHAPHETWQASAVARIEARPQNGRVLIGLVDVLGDDVNDIERTPKGIIKWPAPLGRIRINVDRSTSIVSR
jgi:hypothetical protein